MSPSLISWPRGECPSSLFLSLSLCPFTCALLRRPSLRRCFITCSRNSWNSIGRIPTSQVLISCLVRGRKKRPEFSLPLGVQEDQWSPPAGTNGKRTGAETGPSLSPCPKVEKGELQPDNPDHAHRKLLLLLLLRVVQHNCDVT